MDVGAQVVEGEDAVCVCAVGEELAFEDGGCARGECEGGEDCASWLCE